MRQRTSTRVHVRSVNEALGLQFALKMTPFVTNTRPQLNTAPCFYSFVNEDP